MSPKIVLVTESSQPPILWLGTLRPRKPALTNNVQSK